MCGVRLSQSACLTHLKAVMCVTGVWQHRRRRSCYVPESGQNRHCNLPNYQFVEPFLWPHDNQQASIVFPWLTLRNLGEGSFPCPSFHTLAFPSKSDFCAVWILIAVLTTTLLLCELSNLSQKEAKFSTVTVFFCDSFKKVFKAKESPDSPKFLAMFHFQAHITSECLVSRGRKFWKNNISSPAIAHHVRRMKLLSYRSR